MTPRTKFLLENPKFITGLGVRHGIPYRDLDDFYQDVILTSLLWLDDYDESISTISTYAGKFVIRRIIDFKRKMRRTLKPLSDFEDPAFNEESTD